MYKTDKKQVECLLPGGVAEHDSFQVPEPPAVDGEAESSNTYEKQAQSQVRGDPQSIPLLRLHSPLLPPSSHLHPQHTAAARAERRLYQASLSSSRT